MAIECIQSQVHTAKFHSQEVFQQAPPGLSDIYILNLFEECPFRFLTLKNSCLSLHPVPLTIILLSFFYTNRLVMTLQKEQKKKRKLGAMIDCWKVPNNNIKS